MSGQLDVALEAIRGEEATVVGEQTDCIDASVADEWILHALMSSRSHADAVAHGAV